jgi:hypothetical protein
MLLPRQIMTPAMVKPSQNTRRKAIKLYFGMCFGMRFGMTVA